ncbi:MAG TPA: S49 family peptidase [Rubrobacteraceae bacterium]|nr:S49 family peptidase [Rubrobacteraceae bacterium]
MPLLTDAPINLLRLLRNTSARLFRSAPDYVVIEVRGGLPEFERQVGFLRRRVLPIAAGPTLEGLRERLERISADGRPRGVVVRVVNLDAGWTALEELRGELSSFRRRGGRVIAYLADSVDSRSYYLACAADEVYATPLAALNVTGVRTRVDFLREGLSRVGLEAEVVAVSPYKSAGDPFVRDDFSPEAREQAERLLDRRYEELLGAVSEGRELDVPAARERIDRAPYDPHAALAEGLIDGVCYEDELPERLGAEGERARVVDWRTARGSLRTTYRRSPRRRVGVVSLSGTIVRGRSRRLPVPLPFFGREQAGSESVIAALRTAEKNRRVAAVLFHVDSRGGDALASDLIWREVERIRARKPVVVLMGEVAASGGYYVSAAADHVVARRNTVTGSIGVVLIRPVASDLYRRLGVNPAALERGARAGVLDASRSPDPDEMKVLERQLGYAYGEFKDRVSRGREISPPKLEEIAGGRVWTGAEARRIELVDGLGGFREALRRARELGGITDEASEVLLKVSAPRGGHQSPGEPAEVLVETVGEVWRALSEVREGRLWALAPYDITDG